jgi:hypothetical protein
LTFGRGTPVSCACEADDDTITDIGHGLVNGDVVYFTASVMPTGLSADTIYYVINSTDNTFKVSLTSGGDAVELDTDGTTVVYYADFKIPDTRGYFLRGWDHGAGIDPDAATRTDRGDGTTGDHVGTKQADEFESHHHELYRPASPTLSTAAAQAHYALGTAQVQSGVNTVDTGGNETRPINVNVMFCIKY